MVRKIFKYQLSLQAARNDLTMPTGAEVRCLGHQLGQICLWADVETLAPSSKRSSIIAHRPRRSQRRRIRRHSPGPTLRLARIRSALLRTKPCTNTSNTH